MAFATAGVERWLEGQRGRALTIALCVLAISPLWWSLLTVPAVPTHDGPKNLYASHVLSHLREPAYAAEYDLTFSPTTLGLTAVYGLLERVIGWRLAYATSIGLSASLLPLGVYWIARAFDERRAPLALVGVAVAYGWTSHMGFINYVPSIGLGFVTIGVGVTAASWTLRRELSVYALLTACSLFHPVGAQISALALFVFRAAHVTRGRALRELGAMAIGCVPAGLVTLLARDALAEAMTKGLTGLHLDLTFAERLEGFTRWFLSGPLFRSLFVLALAALGWACALWGLARLARTPARWDRRAVALLTLSAFGLAGAMIAPMHSAVWQYMQPRFLPITVVAALVLVPLERVGARARAALIGLMFAHALASNAWVARAHAAVVERDRPAFAALGATHPEPGRTLLPIVALPEINHEYQSVRDRPIPHASFLMNLGMLYATDRQAVTPYAFTFIPGVHAVVARNLRMPRVPKRDYGKILCEGGATPAERSGELARLASFGTVFDDVMFYGREDDARELISHGYQVEARGEGFFIGQLVGCPGRITVRGDTRVPGVVLVGWPGANRVVESFPLEGALPQSFDVPRGSCRGLSVLVEGRTPDAQLQCRGASKGWLDTLEPGAELVCELELVKRDPKAP